MCQQGWLGAVCDREYSPTSPDVLATILPRDESRAATVPAGGRHVWRLSNVVGRRIPATIEVVSTPTDPAQQSRPILYLACRVSMPFEPQIDAVLSSTNVVDAAFDDVPDDDAIPVEDLIQLRLEEPLGDGITADCDELPEGDIFAVVTPDGFDDAPYTVRLNRSEATPYLELGLYASLGLFRCCKCSPLSVLFHAG